MSRHVALLPIACVGIFLCLIATTQAFAQENSALGQVAQLTVRKGFKDIGLGDVCGRLNIAAGKCYGYQLNAKIDAADSKKSGLKIGWLTSLNVLLEPGGAVTRIIILDHDQHIAYAYLTDPSESPQAVAVGLSSSGNGKDWRWKPIPVTDGVRQNFLLEKDYWLSQRKDIEALPDRQD